MRRSPLSVSRMMQRWAPSKEQYVALRARQRTTDPVFNAARFLFLNHYCFNGVYRENRQGEFNVPYSGERVGPLQTPKQLVEFAEAMRNTTLVCADFSSLLKKVQPQDFVYLDPPYSYRHSRNRGEYGWNAFSDDDVDRLVTALDSVARRGAFVLLSYNRAPLLKRILGNWKLSYCEVNRSIAGFSHARRRVREYQLRNYC